MKKTNHSKEKSNKVIDFTKVEEVDDIAKEINKAAKNDKSKVTEKVIKFGMKYKEVLAIIACYILLSGIGLNLYWAVKHYIITGIVIGSIILIASLRKLAMTIKNKKKK